MNDMTNLVNEAMRRDGWFLVFVFVPVALVEMVWCLSRTRRMNAITS